MKACSFVPSATKMIYDMGLQDSLYGVTFECLSDKPKIVRSVLEGNHYDSEEIDRIVCEYETTGKSLYYVEMELLQSIEPDVVFTQSVCDVCQIGTSYVERAIGSLRRFPQIVPLVPRVLMDVFSTALTIATTLGHPDVGEKYVNHLQNRIDQVIDKLRFNHSPLRRVMVMEWMNPVYNCGHWIPYQISIAGGTDMLSNPAGYSIVTEWEKVVQYNPEVLVIAPCGFNATRALQEVHTLSTRTGWHDLKAVCDHNVYLADADMFTQPSASTLVDGIEALAAMFHPSIFEIPERLRSKIVQLYGNEVILPNETGLFPVR